eukprot:TRINITY_DN5318_c0_g2_i1.p2 TRINITY_DN5318_c0_g2~~TRINITY_DN5318_c0_g2_i1.p2  ORF type:complete len:128 (-),score=38.16 TRINITY_DN5318_c0_g2_i1:74-457(-)
MLNGVTLSLSSQVYMRPCLESAYPAHYRMSGLVVADMGGAAMLVGDSILNGFYAVFDRQNNQMGFAAANCGDVAGTVLLSTPVSASVLPLWAIAVIAAGGGGVVLLSAIVGCAVCYRRRHRTYVTVN